MSKSSYLRIQRRMVKKGIENELLRRLGSSVPRHVIKEMTLEELRKRQATARALIPPEQR